MTKRIQYNRSTKDYDCFVTFDGVEQYIGSSSTHPAAEERVDEYALAYYVDTCTYEKAALVMGRTA